MKNQSRYRYEQRIKKLEAEVEGLIPYRDLARDVLASVATAVREGKVVSHGWLIERFWSVCK